MANIRNWCKRTVSKVKAHSLIYLEADGAKLSTAVADVAAIVPGHYTAPDRVAGILDELGKPAAAAYVAAKLPTRTRSRSGDIGEILASSWVSEFTAYRIGILRLRWKDHREMAMRGDDILAVCLDPDIEMRFLKGEVKSRVSLPKKTVDEARKALLSSHGRPTPHALTFLSDRLAETGEVELSGLIDKYQLKGGIKIAQLSHLMFMFTGNNPCNLLKSDLDTYNGKIQQYAVGLRVFEHQDFIKQVFEKVILDGNKP